MRALAIALPLALLPGCRPRQPAEQPVDAALAIARQAQGAGIDPQRLHLPLMDDLRQLEAARALAQRKLPAAQVAEGFRGARPDPAVGPADRARRYAEQASRRLQRILKGPCEGQLEELGRQLRLGALLGPLPEAPPGFDEVRRRAQEGLADSRLVAVRCEQGSVGMLLVRQGGAWRVVDVVPTGRGGGPPGR